MYSTCVSEHFFTVRVLAEYVWIQKLSAFWVCPARLIPGRLWRLCGSGNSHLRGMVGRMINLFSFNYKSIACEVDSSHLLGAFWMLPGVSWVSIGVSPDVPDVSKMHVWGHTPGSWERQVEIDSARLDGVFPRPAQEHWICWNFKYTSWYVSPLSVVVLFLVWDLELHWTIAVNIQILNANICLAPIIAMFFICLPGGSAPPDPPLSRPGGLRDSRIYSIRYNKNSLCILTTIHQIQQ